MRVTELIEFTNRLSTNHANLTTKERETYLSFLNMANLDLYKVAAAGLDTIVKTQKIYINADDVSFSLPADFFMTRIVFVNKIELPRGKMQDRFNMDPVHASYYVKGRALFLNDASKYLTFPVETDVSDGAEKKYIELIYSPLPLKLVENINDPLNEIDTPIYPDPFHFYLAHGALYYFYLANRVFLEKRSDIKDLWEKNKQELAQYKNYSL